MLQPLPATGHVLGEGLLEAWRGGHDTVLEGRGIAIAHDVQRRDHVLVEACAFVEHRLRGLEPGVFEAGHLRHLRDVRQMLDVEQHVLQGGDVAHECLLFQTGMKKGTANDALWLRFGAVLRAP